MRSPSRSLTFLLACASLLVAPPAASAGGNVDPGDLVPPPPPGAACTDLGASRVICQTLVTFVDVDAPLFPIACGTVLQSAVSSNRGTRWYEDGLLTRRLIHGTFDGRWYLDPAGPSVPISGHWQTSTVWTTPGDDTTEVETFHGLHAAGSAIGIGPALHLAGFIEPDGSVHGLNTIDEPIGQISPESVAVLGELLCD